MAVTKVQSLLIGTAGSGTTLSTSAAPANPTVGNYLVAIAWGWTSNTIASSISATFSITDTGSNSYTIYKQALANDLWLAIGWAKVATSGANFKITVNPGLATSSMNIVGAEFSGVQATSPVDGTPVGTAPGTTANSGMAPGSMTVSAGSLVVAGWVSDDGKSPFATVNGVTGTATTTPAPGTGPTGFTALGTDYNGPSVEVGQGVYAIGPTSPSNPSWSTGSDTAAKWAAQQFALLAAAGSSPVGKLVLAGQAIPGACY